MTSSPTAASASPAGGHRLSTPALIGFSAPAMSAGAISVAVSVYLTHYYAAHFALGLSAVGLAFTVLRLIDMVVDPLLGLAMDRTHMAFGRYRVWLAASVPVLALSIWMLFDPPGQVNLAWLIGWLALYYLGLSMSVLSHSAWASVIAAAYHERSRVFGSMQIIAIVAGVMVLVIPSLHDAILASLGLPRTAISAVGLMGFFIIAITAGGVALALVAAKETVLVQTHRDSFRLKDYLQMALRADMRRVVMAEFCLALGPGWMSALYLFFMRDALGFDLARASFLLLVYSVASIAGAASLSWLARRIGKHQTLMAVCILYSFGLMAVLLIPKANMGLILAQMSYVGFFAGSFPLLTRAMVADIGDAVRLELGSARNGLLYSMITTSQKFGVAISIGVSFTLLSLVGYQPSETAVNTPAAIAGLKLVFALVPIVAAVCGAACFLGYGLNARRHDEIRQQLDHRDAAEKG